MTEPGLRAAIQESVVDVLEKMFFIDVVEEPLEAEKSCRLDMTAHLAFEGEPSGSLTLRTTSAAARSVAAGFLGEDQEALSEQQVGEVVCELANMICGAVLSRVESRAVFRLGSPLLLPQGGAEIPCSGDASATADTPAGIAFRLAEFDGGALMVTVRTEGPT